MPRRRSAAGADGALDARATRRTRFRHAVQSALRAALLVLSQTLSSPCCCCPRRRPAHCGGVFARLAPRLHACAARTSAGHLCARGRPPAPPRSHAGASGRRPIAGPDLSVGSPWWSAARASAARGVGHIGTCDDCEEMHPYEKSVCTTDTRSTHDCSRAGLDGGRQHRGPRTASADRGARLVPACPRVACALWCATLASRGYLQGHGEAANTTLAAPTRGIGSRDGRREGGEHMTARAVPKLWKASAVKRQPKAVTTSSASNGLLLGCGF